MKRRRQRARKSIFNKRTSRVVPPIREATPSQDIDSDNRIDVPEENDVPKENDIPKESVVSEEVGVPQETETLQGVDVPDAEESQKVTPSLSDTSEQKQTKRVRNAGEKKPFFTSTKITIISVALAVFLLAGIVIGILYEMLNSSLQEQDGSGGVYENVDQITAVDPNAKKITFVIVGVDKVAGITDTIMLGSYNFEKNEVNLVSIPRDTRINYGGRSRKINSAYNVKSENNRKKGINGTIEAIKKVTGVQEINYYVEFSLRAFRDAVNALGGVDFDVPENMYHNDPEQGLLIDLKAGMQHLDGNKAEQLVRFRNYKNDPRGDEARIDVQQRFIKAMAEQKLNAEIVGKIPDIFDVVRENIKTNLEAKDIINYALHLKDLRPENVRTYTIPGEGRYIGVASYFIMDVEKTKQLMQEVIECDASGATDGLSEESRGNTAEQPTTEPSPTPTMTPKPTTRPTTRPTVRPQTTPSTSPNVTQTPDSSAGYPVPENPTNTENPAPGYPVPENPTNSENPAPGYPVPESHANTEISAPGYPVGNQGTTEPAPTPDESPAATQAPGGIKRPSAN